MLTIRQAAPEDAPAVAALLNELAATTGQMVIVPIDPSRLGAVAENLRRLASGGQHFLLLASLDDTAAGFLMTSGESHPDRRGVIEIDLGILEPHRGRGIGRRLLREAETLALARGVHRMQLRVLTGNVRAIGLYLKEGYRVEGLMEQVLRRGDALESQYMMAKIIRPS